MAALATVDRMQVHLRAEILSVDGKERVRDEARFSAGHDQVPAKLARAMLERAGEAIRSLFAAA